MSASMPIPGKRKQPIRNTAVSWGSSSEASSYSRTPGSSFTPGHGRTPSNIDKGKSPAVSPTPSEPISPRRPSLMGSSFSKSEYTVINLGHDDGPPRLVTCVKSSQGFDWNQELFLPSYIDHDSHELEHKQDPVQDIILTDEEAAAMLPQ